VMRSLAAHGEGVGVTYSAPESRCAYDGTPLASMPIADAFACEPMILARPLEATGSAIVEPAAKAVLDAFRA